MSQILIMIAIVAYLGVVLAIGFIFSKRNKNADDFYLGGRKLGPFVTAMSAEASDMSNWLLMGLPGVAYLSGVSSAAWTAIGLALGTYVKFGWFLRSTHGCVNTGLGTGIFWYAAYTVKIYGNRR